MSKIARQSSNMIVDRIIALAIWAYALLFAVLLGGSLPGLVESMAIKTASISVGVSLIFLTVPIILFFGVARAGWHNDFTLSSSGYLVRKFGEARIASLIRLLRLNTLLMAVTGLIGILGIANTFMTSRSAVAYCLSSYFLAVGAGHLYAFLFRRKKHG